MSHCEILTYPVLFQITQIKFNSLFFTDREKDVNLIKSVETSAWHK